MNTRNEVWLQVKPIVYLFLVFMMVFFITHPVSALDGEWKLTGSMKDVRLAVTATLLPDGNILVAGGWNGSVSVATSEIYNTSTGLWTTTGSMHSIRKGHSITVLQNGKVLVAGGAVSDFTSVKSAEVFDPVTGTWTQTGTMSYARTNHTATLLPNGKVLVVGGRSGQTHASVTASVELFDPITNTWTTLNSINTARDFHTATLLSNGTILIAGGYRSNGSALTSAEIYNPVTGSWSLTGSMNYALAAHTANLLSNGNVLVAGGFDGNAHVSNAELYNAASGTWIITGHMNERRYGHSSVLLPDGKVLVCGGYSGVPGDYTFHKSTELFDPNTGEWSLTGSMNYVRIHHNVFLIKTDQVIAIGGGDGSSALNSSEIFKTLLTLSINQSSLQEDPTHNSPINFTATFSKPINLSSFTSEDIDTSLSTAPGTIIVEINATTPYDSMNFNVAIKGMTGDGKVIVSIPADAVIDMQGNGNTASNSDDNQVTFEYEQNEGFEEKSDSEEDEEVSELTNLPITGFSKGVVTLLPTQPSFKDYSPNVLSIEIPTLNIYTSIVGVPRSGDSWDVTWLGRNAGYLHGSAFPTFEGNSVITGHVWDADNQPGIFVNLKYLERGDTFKIHAFGQVATYSITQNAIVWPKQVSTVMKHYSGQSWVTLLSCENYNEITASYPHRRMVRAVLIDLQ